MQRVQVVLFDIGGVLTSDPWQSIVLTGGTGLADRLGIEHDLAERVGEALWPSYSLAVREEQSYWRDFAAQAGVEIPDEVVGQAEAETLVVNQGAAAAFALLRERGMQAGFITDNTAFWYPKQRKLIGCDDSFATKYEYLSFKARLSKQSTPVGLFGLAAQDLSGSATLVVDDRPKNIQAARQAGLATLTYSMFDGDLTEALRSVLDGG